MKFHALLPVRDEADILAQNLTQLLTWADAIYVFDTGSVDESWEIVQDFAGRDKRIIPLAKESVYYSEAMVRGYLFNQARSRMRDGDWFLRVDADEFHHVAPPEFVRACLQPHETIAYYQYYDFMLTQSEVAKWESGEETLADRARPIVERRRYYMKYDYTEPRLCRYRSTMKWPVTVSFPFNAGFVARERLPIRHYPFRDPAQVQRRCALRQAMMSDPAFDGQSFTRWKMDWTESVTADDAPGLVFWKPGTELPRYPFLNHLAPPGRRAVQRMVHACLLPLLDATRPSFPDDARPRPLPASTNETLRQVLARSSLN